MCGYLGWSLPFDGGCCSLSPLRAPGPAATFWTGEQKRTACGQEPKGFGTLEEDLDCGGILCLNDSLRGNATPPRTSRSVIFSARPRDMQSASVSPTTTDEKEGGQRRGPPAIPPRVESLWFAAVLDNPPRPRRTQKAVQKREEIEKRRKEAGRQRTLEVVEACVFECC